MLDGKPLLPQVRRKARATDSVVGSDRRAFLKLAMAQGVAAPVALAAMEQSAFADQPASETKLEPVPRKGTMRKTNSSAGSFHASGAVVRDFADPYLELLRLLREAAEIEHALMLQYLFCAFTLRKPFADLGGHGSATADNMIGVAIQEMQHLGAVNRLLVSLGSCPHLDRQDFPYEPDMYPFVFELEPLSRSALAKYVYVEGPSNVFDMANAKSDKDKKFINAVFGEMSTPLKPNHIGSLYRSILDMLSEVGRAKDSPLTSDDVAKWTEELRRIMDEGEDDHYKFFRDTFEAKHATFSGRENAWNLKPDDVNYPSYNIPRNPTAYIGHPNQIQKPGALVLAWLGNLHYWLTLSTLDFAYRTGDDGAVDHAMAQMMSSVWPLASELPKYGTGLPFDPLSMGYALGSNSVTTKKIIASFGKEALQFAKAIKHRLPENYDDTATTELVDYMKA